jgi:NAD(P)H-dependent flavin oxidoreductase YrpB (nitropropane dioxygenase family)
MWPDRRLLDLFKTDFPIVLAIWLEENGTDVIIAQGAEAGGQCGMFLTENRQPARPALAASMNDSTVIINVITGRPARGVANRLMREVGPISAEAPAFPHAASGLAPLKAVAEKLGKVDFTNLWAGQGARLRTAGGGTDPGALAGVAPARLSRLAG